MKNETTEIIYNDWIFTVCAPPPSPSLVGAYFAPPDARAISLDDDLLCYDVLCN